MFLLINEAAASGENTCVRQIKGGMGMSFGRQRPVWLALFLAGILYGQAELATVRGVVTDAAKAVIPGVRVTVRNTDTDIAHTVTTNQEGYFAVPELPAGPYVIEAANAGFEVYREKGIVLETGQTFDITIKLSVGSVNESVEVTADVANLNTENGTVTGYVVTKAEIEDMPLITRDFTELAFYVPGVAIAPAGEPGQNLPPLTVREPTAPISSWTESMTATCAAPRRSCGPISTRCKSSRWRPAASRLSTAKWPAA